MGISASNDHPGLGWENQPHENREYLHALYRLDYEYLGP